MKKLSEFLTICGDLHILEETAAETEKIFDLIESKGNDVVLLGDQLDTKKIINGFCQNLLFERLKNSPLQFVVLVGNHDRFDLEDESAGHSMECLKSLPNVKVVDSLTEIEGLFFLPYIHEDGEVKKVISKIPSNSILFGHLNISEFDYGNGHLHKSDFKSESLKKFKKVISGHYHLMQDKGNILYLGTPRSKNHSETNQIKYLGIFDTKTSEISLEETRFSRHRTYTVDTSKGEKLPEMSNADHNRVILLGSEEDIASFERLDTVSYVPRPNETEIVGEVISETASHVSQFTQWAEDIEELPEDIVKLGVGILREVL